MNDSWRDDARVAHAWPKRRSKAGSVRARPLCRASRKFTPRAAGLSGHPGPPPWPDTALTGPHRWKRLRSLESLSWTPSLRMANTAGRRENANRQRAVGKARGCERPEAGQGAAHHDNPPHALTSPGHDAAQQDELQEAAEGPATAALLLLLVSTRAHVLHPRSDRTSLPPPMGRRIERRGATTAPRTCSRKQQTPRIARLTWLVTPACVVPGGCAPCQCQTRSTPPWRP